MRRIRRHGGVLLACIVMAAAVGAMAAFGGMAAADQHTPEDAPDLSDEANFTVNLPHATDHHPGSQNAENGSIQYFAAGDDAFAEVGAADGAYFDYIEIGAEWIDYSDCSTDNTEAFGIDRGGDNDGIQYDDDLLDHQERNRFHDGGIDIWFYDWDAFAGEPPFMAPEDQVVAAQGQGSSAGTCLHMTDEPGWYQIQAFVNGTVADNGEGEQPSEDADQIGINLQSNYLYVCDCDSREEAEEQLGPAPPDQNGEDDDETTTDDTDETTDDDADDTDETTTDDTDETTDDSGEATTDDTADDTGEAESTDDAGGAGTPTPGDGPGFGAAAALLALLASALLTYRRRD